MSDHLRRLGAAFERAGYTVEGVRALLGPVAGGALARDEVVPALRATGGGSPLEALTRLFWLQVPVPVPAVGGLADDLAAAGLVEVSAGEARALLRVQPLESVAGEANAGNAANAAGVAGEADVLGPVRHIGYVVSDLKAVPGSGTVRSDHVVGAGGASAALARLAVHSPVDNALDLGTGSGVQALHLAGRARRITATDVNPRALRLAAMSVALSGAGTSSCWRARCWSRSPDAGST